MTDTDVDLGVVRRSLAEKTREVFRRRVREQAEFLREELTSGQLDNPGFAIGLELEAYAVDGEGRLARVPESVFEAEIPDKELGMHNVEVNTEPTVFDAKGIRAQVDAIRAGVERTREACRREGLELVLDGMWSTPPAEGTAAYLGDIEHHEGVFVAANMRPASRYVALDNDVLSAAGGSLEFSVPGSRREYPSILVESLATSIQPHLQVPAAEAFPDYYNAAIRTLGPVLALATNSPFLPPDLYDNVEDPDALVAATHHELRIAAFEQPMNAGRGEKVRFPDDIEDPVDAIAAIADDEVYAPFLAEWDEDGEEWDEDGGFAGEEYANRFPEFDHQRSTYWRWLRPVIGGDPVGGGSRRSLRIEYRPLPTQPTVADNVAMQLFVAGLLRGLVAADHPLADLEWEAARRCFYDVVERGPNADLAWLLADGRPATNPERIYEELFALTRRGLHEAGVDEAAADRYLEPVERRRARELVPSAWKKRQVRQRLAAGQDLADAIEGMQREYIRRARIGEPFAEW